MSSMGILAKKADKEHVVRCQVGKTIQVFFIEDEQRLCH